MKTESDMFCAIAPGECKEVHFGPEGEVGAIPTRPIEEALADWGYQLPEYAAIETNAPYGQQSRYLLLVHPYGSTLILWDDDGGEVITGDRLLR